MTEHRTTRIVTIVTGATVLASVMLSSWLMPIQHDKRRARIVRDAMTKAFTPDPAVEAAEQAAHEARMAEYKRQTAEYQRQIDDLDAN